MPPWNLRLFMLLVLFIANTKQEDGGPATEEMTVATLSTEDLAVTLSNENVSIEKTADKTSSGTTIILEANTLTVPMGSATSGNGGAARMRLATPAPEILKCFTCHSIDGPNRCNSVGARSLEPCDLEACHYIFGSLAINNVTKVPNLTIAGCGHAPVAEFSVMGHKVFTPKTHHNDAKCASFEYSSKEDSARENHNDTVLFIGHSCNCRFDSCNTENRMLALISSSHQTVLSILVLPLWFFSLLR